MMTDAPYYNLQQPGAPTPSPTGAPPRSQPPTVIVQAAQPPSIWRSWVVRFLVMALVGCVFAMMGMYGQYQQYFAKAEGPTESYFSGSKDSNDKLLLLQVQGTIMPPFTERVLKNIEAAIEQDDIKGVLLEVDSPGGLVADSHEIYHRLKELSAKKPVFVQMKRLAASGGYYIAMGAGPEGKIFAEPTTWTGSIGVIIPRYDASQLADKFGVKSEPLKTGEFKDALNPFRKMDDGERKLWENILDQSFAMFKDIIDTNRTKLDADAVAKVATGEIFTAQDALKNGLVDEIGFLDDSLKALKEKAGLASARVVRFEHPLSLTDVLAGNVKAREPKSAVHQLLEATVPRAYFLCSWLPSLE